MTALPSRKPRILCFGEVLWDCLPQGRFLGGAPLNVAYHLHQLGCEAIMVSAVGADRLGEETLQRMTALGLSTAWVARHPHLPTGTVEVTLGPSGQPTYRIVADVAWDHIPVDDRVTRIAGGCDALVFGSLAARGPGNLAGLERLLRTPDPRRILDVNLRPPFDDRDRVLGLCRSAELIRLNDDELGRLAQVDRLSGCASDEPRLRQAIESFAKLAGVQQVCVTLGPRGAVYWRDGQLFSAAAPEVEVKDTIGAGDAFTAALVAGLLADDANEAIAATLERACRLGALVASLPGAQPPYDGESHRPPTTASL